MKIFKLFFTLFVLFVASFAFYFYYQIFTPTENFPINKSFSIEKGEAAQTVLQNLEKQRFIRDSFMAKILLKIIPLNLKNGEYFWDYPASTFQILQGVNVKQKVYKITIPEGYTKYQIAEKLEDFHLKNFNKKDFLEKANEGYLFPDTYFLEATNDTESILKKFSQNFEKRVGEKFDPIPSKEQIILASILEREARKSEDMRVVSGILKNRLAINMPLQVDATVLYGKGAWKDQTLFSDLKSKTENEKLYNTYEIVGLPIGPISNPSVNAISAAMFPVKSDYLYYLTGSDGNMHYAKKFEEHVANRKYLR